MFTFTTAAMVELPSFSQFAQVFFCMMIGFYVAQLKIPNDENTGDADNLNDNNPINDRYGLLDGKPPPSRLLVTHFIMQIITMNDVQVSPSSHFTHLISQQCQHPTKWYYASIPA